MKNVIIATIIIAILAIAGYGIVSVQPEPVQQVPIVNNVNIDVQLQGNKAAQEIAAMGLEVRYAELGNDTNGYTVRGQTQFYKYNDGSEEDFKVTLDDDIDPNSYDAYAILYHEMGHIVNKGANDTEANADAFAGTKGYKIVDAYNGVH